MIRKGNHESKKKDKVYIIIIRGNSNLHKILVGFNNPIEGIIF